MVGVEGNHRSEHLGSEDGLHDRFGADGSDKAGRDLVANGRIDDAALLQKRVELQKPIAERRQVDVGVEVAQRRGDDLTGFEEDRTHRCKKSVRSRPSAPRLGEMRSTSLLQRISELSKLGLP